MSIEVIYRGRFEKFLMPLAVSLQQHIEECLNGCARIDRISSRPKTVKSFVDKTNKLNEQGAPKYENPFSQIQDQIGARIITFYKDDIDRISDHILRYYRPIEEQNKTPRSEWEFGYFGKHFILFIPSDLIDPDWQVDQFPLVFELQIKTLFQHSWSEANHDLGYKPDDVPFLPDEKRSLAFASAQAWGADRIFNDLFRNQQTQLPG